MSRAERSVHDVLSGRVFPAGPNLFLRSMFNILTCEIFPDVMHSYSLHVHTWGQRRLKQVVLLNFSFGTLKKSL